jgi:predicted nucleic acid-binding protein
LIFIDSNIPMYLIGAQHPNKAVATRLLETAVTAGERLVTDAEVLQEILHRYAAINRRDAIEPAFDALLGIVDEVYAIDVPGLQLAKRLLETSPSLSARDAIHVAMMQRRDIGTIMTFDRGFDGIPGLVRLA